MPTPMTHNIYPYPESGTQVLGCALVKDIGLTEGGLECAELTAFCIHPLARGAGRGDSLLDFLEQVR